MQLEAFHTIFANEVVSIFGVQLESAKGEPGSIFGDIHDKVKVRCMTKPYRES